MTIHQVMEALEELTTKSAVELVELIRSHSVSPVEVARAHLRQIERLNPRLNAIVTIAADAIDQARAAEVAVMSQTPIGVLHGLPITIKDTIDTEGLRTTSGSRLRTNNVPVRDATVVARLKSAGAIVIGKTNTPEMAIPYETDNPIFGRTNNPYNLECTAGGSSGGEAAAIAACLSPAGLGSDLSGSIRVPAHFCGIAGLKPTTSRVPMDGHFPSATGPLSLGACIGPMARHVADLSLLFEVIADERQESREDINLNGVRAAWYVDDEEAPVSDEIKLALISAATALAHAGVEMREARPPAVVQGSRLWVELFAQAATDQFWNLYRGRELEAGPLVADLLVASYREENGLPERARAAERAAKALVERERLREELLRWMRSTPLLLTPVGATVAFPHGTQRLQIGKHSMSVFRAFSYAQSFNVFGFPCVTVPIGLNATGLPIGVQIVGRPFAEKMVLAAAQALEDHLGGWQPPHFDEASMRNS